VVQSLKQACGMISAVPHQLFRLPDGRQLSFQEFGEASGQPILYFHGTPGSRVDAATFVSDPALSGLVHVVAADRPGYGYSTPLKDSSPETVVSDAESLADHLGWEHFAVSGADQGGLYALACAALLPTRVTSVALFGGLTTASDEPQTTSETTPGRFRHTLMRRCLGLLLSIVPAVARTAPRAYVRAGVRFLPPADQEVLRAFGLEDTLLASVKEQYRQRSLGLRGEIHHCVVGFDLGDVQVPVFMWHGEQDRTPPVAATHALAHRLANATVIECPGEGRLVRLHHAREVVQALRGS
jgi:pimeloyl-ACP methyl ester carboxylesterase